MEAVRQQHPNDAFLDLENPERTYTKFKELLAKLLDRGDTLLIVRHTKKEGARNEKGLMEYRTTIGFVHYVGDYYFSLANSRVTTSSPTGGAFTEKVENSNVDIVDINFNTTVSYQVLKIF